MLSICIPSYNYGHHLPAAIDSCLREDEEFELVVLDNCSSDETPSLRDRYIGDRRVKWHRNETLLPIQQNWNRAVDLSTGDHVKLLQADDYLLPGGISKILKWCRNSPRIGMHGHLAHVVDNAGNLVRKQRTFGGEDSYFEVRGPFAARMKLRMVGRFREPSSNVFLREAWSALGGYSSDYRVIFDLHFNSRVTHAFGGRLWSGYAAALRRHPGSDGARLPAGQMLGELKEYVAFLEKLSGDELTRSDCRHGWASIQYRLLELFAQRVRRNPSDALKFLRAEASVLLRISSWPDAFGILVRRALYSDVQSRIPQKWIRSI